MSGKPSPDGAARLIAALTKIETLSNEISVLEQAAARIKPLREDLGRAYQAVKDLLREMDCEPGSNYGTDQRMLWLLTEMLRQARADTVKKMTETT